MKRLKIVSLLAIIVALTAMWSVAIAATPEEIEDSIVLGLAWLADQQQADGSWASAWSPPANTGLAVLKFEDRGKELAKVDPEIDGPFDPDYEYSGNVIDGLDYLFSQMISDANGVHFAGGGYEVYTTGIGMMAVAGSNAPSRVVNVAGSAVDGWTYQQVLQGMLDWMVFAQNTSGCEIGGWGYTGPDPGWSDNSNSGYATLGLGFAAAAPPDGFGLTIPAGVLTILDQFIDNVQVGSGPYEGGSIYNPCWTGSSWTNTLKTGNLLYELRLVGDDATSARVQSAVDFIATYWANNGGDCDGCGWRADYQAMFTMMKGLQSQGINTLPGDINWFDEVSTYIVTNQQGDGRWTGGVGRGDDVLKTAWALLTLEKVVPEEGPPCPECPECPECGTGDPRDLIRDSFPDIRSLIRSRLGR